MPLLSNVDPCFTKNIIVDWRRSLAYTEMTTAICDNFLLEQWYRVISGAGELMPIMCMIGGFRCGTRAPYWLSSSTYYSKNNPYSKTFF